MSNKRHARAEPVIHRFAPTFTTRPLRSHLLRVEDIQPCIRIAHRLNDLIVISERVIFDHEMVVILAGTGYLTMGDGAIVPFRAHDLLFLQPFVPHAFTTTPGTRLDHIAIHFDWANGCPSVTDDLGDRRPYAVHFPRGLTIPLVTRLTPAQRIEAESCALVDDWQTATQVGELSARARLTGIAAQLFVLPPTVERAAAETAKQTTAHPIAALDHGTRARLHRALAVMDDRYGESWTVADLARCAGLSSSHFARLFQQWMGCAPMAYLRRVRVDRAKILLKDVNIPIKVIAARTGFTDPFHFSKVFRQIDGLSPSHFRASVSAGMPGIPPAPS